MSVQFKDACRVRPCSKLNNIVKLLPSTCISVVIVKDENQNDGLLDYEKLHKDSESFLKRRYLKNSNKQIAGNFQCHNTILIAITATGDCESLDMKLLSTCTLLAMTQCILALLPLILVNFCHPLIPMEMTTIAAGEDFSHKC